MPSKTTQSASKAITYKQPVYDEKTVAEIRSWTHGCDSWLEARAIIAKRIGSHPDNVTKMHKRHVLWMPSAGGVDGTVRVSTTTVNDTSKAGGEMVSEVETNVPKTLDEVVQLCKVDLDQWEAKTFGLVRKKNSYGWSARFARRTKPQDGTALVEHFETFAREMEARAPKSFKLAPLAANGDRVLEIAVMDAHFARLCWNKETRGPDYDLKIAIKDYKDAVYGLAAHAKANGVSRILLPLGNDHFNSDNMAGTTTHGTPQAPNEDGRWQKSFTAGCEVVTEVIETLAREFEVDVLIVSGNHDYEKCYYMGEFVRAYFRNHKRVTIDNAPTQRKYYHFGINLTMFTHGNEEKHGDLPLIMASEMKEAWSKTTCREIHLGHYHQHRSTEKNGVRTRVISSLAAADSWSASKGYVGNLRAAEAFLYDKERGLIAQYYHNVAA